MAKKLQLRSEPESEYQLIGIVCMLKDYRLTYHLNKHLFLDLVKKDDLNAEAINPGKAVNFSFYYFEETGNRIKLYLIGNKNENGMLLSEFRQADYFLLINGLFPSESMDKYLKTIRDLPSVMTAYKIDVNKYKKLDTFFSDIELHTIPAKKE